jgi:hypothetical protein
MDNIPNELAERLCRALGSAVVKLWSHLPQEMQHKLFEEAVASQDAGIRSELATFLHNKHSRTAASMKANAMLEPDSLGG